MKRIGIFLLFSSSALTACGPEETYTFHSKATYRYEFQTPGCTTGAHVFATLREYCQALIDENLNQTCAQSIRQAEFEAQCENVI